MLRPPGPRGVTMVQALATRRRSPTDFFTAIARAHPRLAHVRIGAEHYYFLTHPDVIREVYVTNGRFTVKGRALQRSKVLLGEGLLTAEGEHWRRQRRLVQPAFHRDRIRSYADDMVAATLEHTAQHWTDGRQVDLVSELSTLTLTIVGRALFGSDLSGDSRTVGAALGQMLAGSRRRVLPGGQLLDRLPLPVNARIESSIAGLDAVVQRLIDEHRAAGDTGDVLSMLLAARDEDDGTGMSDRQVRDEVMTLLLAGHETTAVGLSWTFWLLSQNPQQAAALRTEVAATVGGRPPTFDDLARLPLTTATFAEALRLYPPAWTLGRRLTADLRVDGWTLPAGSLAVASQWVLHRDPRFWTRPLAFEPARWLDAEGGFDEAAPGQPRGAWFPFGLGQRVCVGESFAWAEGALVLATLAQRWDPEVDPDYDALPEPSVTLRPRAGLPTTLRARSAI